MAGKLQVQRGTFDILPEQEQGRRRIQTAAESIFSRAGYGRIETPTFETTELFARGVGESTDVVQKEMYTFDDGGGRSITLRPEGTAPVCRAYIEHGMHKLAQPVKLWYLSSFYRHEAPQAGRYRQFWQVGAEAIGSDDPALDAESISLLAELLESVGVSDVKLRLASLGSSESRLHYRDVLTAYLQENVEQLSAEVKSRIELNPLRAFDSDHPGTRAVMASAPQLIDYLDAEDQEHFGTVKELLDSVGVGYEVDGTLVRGLDYYCRTVFEFTSTKLGAQSGVGGGGRYDGLVEQLGGQPAAGVGWAAGIERILLAADDQTQQQSDCDLFVAIADQAVKTEAFKLAQQARSQGLVTQLELAGRSLKGQFKLANKLSARWVVVVGDDLQLKDMDSGEQSEIKDFTELLQRIKPNGI